MQRLPSTGEWAKLSFVKTLVTASPEEAARILISGGVVAFPTETVYGLGANVFDEIAIGKVFAAKRRPSDNPLIAHISSLSQLDELTHDVTQDAKKLTRAFWPGPLTVVLKKARSVPEIATAGLDTIGIRMPRLPIAREFLAACGVPAVAPSANISGRPSPTEWQSVLEDLAGRIDCILEGRPSEVGIESTVVDCTGEVPVVLRKGSVSLEQIREVIPETVIYIESNMEAPRSPGLRHRHYSPSARVVAGTIPDAGDLDKAAFIGLEAPKRDFALIRVFRTVEDYARSLYEFFRECDRAGIQTIYCEPVTESGIGAALMDRIRRAAAK